MFEFLFLVAVVWCSVWCLCSVFVFVFGSRLVCVGVLVCVRVLDCRCLGSSLFGVCTV